MFSFSFRWLWAQCLAIAVGLVLLGYLAAPGDDALSTVSGRVESVGSVSRKGLGTYYRLAIVSADGRNDEVLVARGASTDGAMQGLIGAVIIARVDWSGSASQITRLDGSSVDSGKLRSTLNATRRTFFSFAALAALLGLALAAVTFMRRTQPTRS